jgi:pantetheine-phosphate adenylyltransferase
MQNLLNKLAGRWHIGLHSNLPHISTLRKRFPQGGPVPRSTGKKKIAIFPGTFDPPTLGHLDIIERGCKLFDHLIVAIGVNPTKEHLFPPDERYAMLKALTRKFPDVSVEAYDDLTVQLVKRRGAAAILRGLRNLSDMDYEFRAALTNRKVAGVETVFIMTREEFGFTSSSLIKQIVLLGGNPRQLKGLLPDPVIRRLIYYRDKKLGTFAAGPREPA